MRFKTRAVLFLIALLTHNCFYFLQHLPSRMNFVPKFPPSYCARLRRVTSEFYLKSFDIGILNYTGKFPLSFHVNYVKTNG